MSGKRKSQQALISDFFKKRLVVVETTEKQVLSDSQSLNGVSEAPESKCENNSNIEINDLHGTQEKSDNSCKIQETVATKKICHPNDIGLFLNKETVIPDNEKVELLQTLWQPPASYKFPILEKFKERRLKFQHSWFIEFPWLAYSELEEGAFCKYCFFSLNTELE